MAALTRELELLESAVGYALASTAMVTPQVLSRPTPCPAWDLAMLLGHITDSVDVSHEAISARSQRPPRGVPGPDPVPLHGPACPGDELVAFLGRRPFRGDSEGSTWSA